MKLMFWRKPAQLMATQRVADMPCWQSSAIDDDGDASRCRHCGQRGVRVVQLPGHSYAVCADNECLKHVAEQQCLDVRRTNLHVRIQPLRVIV